MSAAKRILPIIDIDNKIKNSKITRSLILDTGSIDFKDVTFNYESKINNIVLKSIDINIKGRKTTALVGHSGAGKSTLLNLIPRIYEVNKGKIEIDGQNIKDLDIKSLRKEISIVDQNITLFDDTVFNNIRYAKPDAKDEEIYKAADLSMCSDFINNLENKFDTIIGENGVRLSGGEKQRLSIARAILKKSSIILLDEATSSLDSETEEKIQKAIEFLTKDKTTLVIAHRLSTILNADNIYVLDKGKVVGSGNHENLMKQSETYKNYYNRQIKTN